MKGHLLIVLVLAVALSASAQEIQIATTLSFTEGPAVDRAGNVYFTDLITQRIMKLGTDGVLSTFREKIAQAQASN